MIIYIHYNSYSSGSFILNGLCKQQINSWASQCSPHVKVEEEKIHDDSISWYLPWQQLHVNHLWDTVDEWKGWNRVYSVSDHTLILLPWWNKTESPASWNKKFDNRFIYWLIIQLTFLHILIINITTKCVQAWNSLKEYRINRVVKQALKNASGITKVGWFGKPTEATTG